jgi:pSer/pThr/pTyr-binding forkhead associated (FHA) protein
MPDAPNPLLLRVLSGPGRAGFALLRAGQEVVIGRDDRSAGLCLDDPLASRAHAAVRMTPDGRCYVRDLGSRNGTRLDGEPLRAEVALVPGARIEIGGSTIGLAALGGADARAAAGESRGTVEAAPAETPRPAVTGAEERAPETGAGVESGASATARAEPSAASGPTAPAGPLRVFGWIVPVEALARQTPEAPQGPLQRRLLQAAAGPLYALIDSAVDDQAPAALALRGYPIYTLFEGEWAESLAFIGPCLVPAVPPESLVDYFVAARGRHLGILLESPAPLEDMVRHLRSIFVVTDEEGQEYFFRFYDPRVLRAFLPTCTPEELRELFGPISRIYLEDPELPDGLRVASLEAQSLRVEELRASLSGDAAAQ